ncbi:O-antigen ligase family protein [Chelativorans xinjiangense]|uniref:O-antigen ligase family protein n=1 Tax=Chelativorans xinjiangense TaxID=2681485 RepID=UPI00135C5BA3
MQSAQLTAVDLPEGGLQTAARTVLFMALFFFLWISLNPFVDLTGEAALDPSASNSNRLNQLVFLGLFGGILLFGMLHPLRGAIFQPLALLVPLFCWILFVSMISSHPMLGVKGVVLAVLVTVNASIYLLIPASERHFAKMIAFGTMAVLALSYFGIIFKPTLAIHQASELREPMNAGFWRGHFPHKNSAAAAMVVSTFFGLFVMRAWSRVGGAAIAVLAAFFLFNTGGKTSSAMLPAIIVLTWAFERFRILRVPIAVGGIALFNLLAIGSAVIKPFGELLTNLGIDATFTNRADIWRFAFSAIADSPILGHGFKAFWQTEELVYSGGTIETWAVAAANGHNSYLDITLMTGVPGLVLTLIWIVFLPLRDISRIRPEEQRSPLTRLYTRIWLYTLFNAGLESLFYEGGNPLWFTFLLALYGFRYQSSAQIVHSPRRLAG